MMNDLCYKKNVKNTLEEKNIYYRLYKSECNKQLKRCIVQNVLVRNDHIEFFRISFRLKNFIVALKMR